MSDIHIGIGLMPLAVMSHFFSGKRQLALNILFWTIFNEGKTDYWSKTWRSTCIRPPRAVNTGGQPMPCRRQSWKTAQIETLGCLACHVLCGAW